MPSLITLKKNFTNKNIYDAPNKGEPSLKNVSKKSSAKNVPAQDTFEGPQKLESLGVSADAEVKSSKFSFLKKKRTYLLGGIGASVLGFAGYGIYAAAPKIISGIAAFMHSTPLAAPLFAAIGVSVAILGAAIVLMMLYNKNKIKKLEASLKEKELQTENNVKENIQEQVFAADNATIKSNTSVLSGGLDVPKNNTTLQQQSAAKSGDNISILSQPKFTQEDGGAFDFSQWR